MCLLQACTSELLLCDVTTINSCADQFNPFHFLHSFSFGITSDPLTQFSACFAALIHDLDHPGVPNAYVELCLTGKAAALKPQLMDAIACRVLVKENDAMAIKYKNKSVAECNSCDLALDILNEPCFHELRACIYTNDEELMRFRSIVVNLVLATDIMDKELGALRKARWDRAFNKAESALCADDNKADASDVNRKATIVLEHLIQASDIAHTMQHWHIYRKWVSCFFLKIKRTGDRWYLLLTYWRQPRLNSVRRMSVCSTRCIACSSTADQTKTLLRAGTRANLVSSTSIL